MTQRSVVAALMPAAAFRDVNEYFLPFVLFPYLLVISWQHLVSCFSTTKKYIILRDTDESTHRRKGMDVGLGFRYVEGRLPKLARRFLVVWY